MSVRNHFLRLLAGMLLAAGLFALGGQQANADDLATIKQRGTLIVGVKADYPPFGFRSPSGEIVGIEPALAADVAKSLGVKLELVPVVASNRMQFLQQGKIDLIIATMNGTQGSRMGGRHREARLLRRRLQHHGAEIDEPEVVGRAERQAGVRHRGRLLQL